MKNIKNPEVAAYWDQNSAIWSDQVRKGYDIYREHINNPSIFQLIGNVNNKLVLDAGCGEGYNTRKLAQLGAKVTGIDISQKMLSLALEEEARMPLGIEYKICSFTDMRIFSDNTFDMVVSFMALMDGPDYPSAIREISRVLKPGGQFIFSVTHPCFLTHDQRWIYSDDCKEERLIIGDYFNSEPYVDEWKFGQSPEAKDLPNFQVPYFPRTLSGYLNPLMENSMEILKIVEPIPNEETRQKFPLLAKWGKHAAIFLQVKAQKK